MSPMLDPGGDAVSVARARRARWRRFTGRRPLGAFLLLALPLILAGPTAGAEWGGVRPGATTIQEVRERYGSPSVEMHAMVEGYDARRWVYEGDQVPRGLFRMTVEFGLLTSDGFKPAVVRLLKLEPRPSIFERETVVDGWGVPDGVGTQDGLVTEFYTEGLFVMFDEKGENAVTMIFSIPQPALRRGAKPTSAPPNQ